MKRMILIVAAAGVGLVVLLFGGVIFVMMGGTGMLEAKWDVHRRGFASDQPAVAGRALRLLAPKGFAPATYQYLVDIPKDDGQSPFAQRITDSAVEFELRLGLYIPINSREWSALLIVDVARAAGAPLEPLDGDWRPDSSTGGMDTHRLAAENRIGFAVTSAPLGRRLRVVSKRGIYAADQCERIARESFASLDPFALAELFAKRDARLARMPENRAEALRALEEAGFKPLPAQEDTVVASAQGDLFHFREGLNSGTIWFRVGSASAPKESFAALREDAAVTGALVKQAHMPSGLMLTRVDNGRLTVYRLTAGTGPIEESQPAPPFLAKALANGELTVWRMRQTPALSEADSRLRLTDWLADSERLRASPSPVWKLEP